MRDLFGREAEMISNTWNTPIRNLISKIKHIKITYSIIIMITLTANSVARVLHNNPATTQTVKATANSVARI